MTRTIVVTTLIDAGPDVVWREVGTTRLLRFVTSPLISFSPVEPITWPDVWEAGEYLCSMRLFGFLPIGRQVIDISFPPPDGDTRFVRDNGRSASIKRWDHWISISPKGEGTRYEDRLDLDAGWRTPIVAAFAKAFYIHRQARLRKLAARQFSYEEAA